VVSALFPIVDPIGGAPVFLLLTRDYAAETRRVLARRIAVDSFILMIASFTLGAHVLSFFGISLPVVQVGGGLIVISSGWAMLNQKNASRSRLSQANRHLRRCSEPGVLPADASFDSWPRLHLDCDHFGRECAAAPGRKPAGNSRGGDRFRFHGSNHLSLLRLRRSAREQNWPHGDERNFKAHRVPAGVHWSADIVERREQIAQFVAAV
jgi:hypothetical protein